MGESIDSMRTDTLRARNNNIDDIEPADDLENAQSPCGTVGQHVQKPNLSIRRNSIPSHSKQIHQTFIKEVNVVDSSYIERWITQYWRNKIEPI